MRSRLAVVTGATGFIGSHLARTLANQGWTVRVTTRARSRLDRIAGTPCQQVPLDLTQSTDSQVDQALAGATHVFHVAGLVCGSAQQLQTVNCLGTERLVAHAARMDAPPKMILVSSMAAAGPSAPGERIFPDSIPQPVSNYGQSKLAGERKAIASRGDAPLAIVRPGIVFGPGDTEFVRLLRAMVRLRVNPMIGRGQTPLSMIHVDDLVRLLILAADNPQHVGRWNSRGDAEGGEGIFHAADPEPLSMVELGRLVRESSGRRVLLQLPIPKLIGYAIGASSELIGQMLRKPTTLNRDKIREATATGWAIDVEKSISQLGWSPAKSLEARLRETVDEGMATGIL